MEEPQVIHFFQSRTSQKDVYYAQVWPEEDPEDVNAKGKEREIPRESTIYEIKWTEKGYIAKDVSHALKKNIKKNLREDSNYTPLSNTALIAQLESSVEKAISNSRSHSEETDTEGDVSEKETAFSEKQNIVSVEEAIDTIDNKVLNFWDVDGTLIKLKRQDDELHTDLIDVLAESEDTRKGFIFTSMSVADVLETAGISDLPREVEAAHISKRMTRQQLVKEMEDRGLEVCGVVMPIDPFYDKGPGAAYKDIIVPAYELAKNLTADEIKNDPAFILLESTFLYYDRLRHIYTRYLCGDIKFEDLQNRETLDVFKASEAADVQSTIERLRNIQQSNNIDQNTHEKIEELINNFKNVIETFAQDIDENGKSRKYSWFNQLPRNVNPEKGLMYSYVCEQQQKGLIPAFRGQIQEINFLDDNQIVLDKSGVVHEAIDLQHTVVLNKIKIDTEHDTKLHYKQKFIDYKIKSIDLKNKRKCDGFIENLNDPDNLKKYMEGKNFNELIELADIARNISEIFNIKRDKISLQNANLEEAEKNFNEAEKIFTKLSDSIEKPQEVSDQKNKSLEEAKQVERAAILLLESITALEKETGELVKIKDKVTWMIKLANGATSVISKKTTMEDIKSVNTGINLLAEAINLISPEIKSKKELIEFERNKTKNNMQEINQYADAYKILIEETFKKYLPEEYKQDIKMERLETGEYFVNLTGKLYQKTDKKTIEDLGFKCRSQSSASGDKLSIDFPSPHRTAHFIQSVLKHSGVVEELPELENASNLEEGAPEAQPEVVGKFSGYRYLVDGYTHIKLVTIEKEKPDIFSTESISEGCIVLYKEDGGEDEDIVHAYFKENGKIVKYDNIRLSSPFSEYEKEINEGNGIAIIENKDNLIINDIIDSINYKHDGLYTIIKSEDGYPLLGKRLNSEFTRDEKLSPLRSLLSGLNADIKKISHYEYATFNDESKLDVRENNEEKIIYITSEGVVKRDQEPLTVKEKTLIELAKTAHIICHEDVIPPAFFHFLQIAQAEDKITITIGDIKNILESSKDEKYKYEQVRKNCKSLGFKDEIHFDNIVKKPFVGVVSGVVHTQDIKMLVHPEVHEGHAYPVLKTGSLENVRTGKLVSAVGLDFGISYWRNMLGQNPQQVKAAITQLWESILTGGMGADYFVLPAIGLGRFLESLNPKQKETVVNFYFQSLCEVLNRSPYKEKFKKVYFNPVQFGNEFDKIKKQFEHSNGCLEKTDQDVAFLFNKLLEKGKKAALLNPSDRAVLQGKMNIGMYSLGGDVVFEEWIGIFTTACLGSKGFCSPENDPFMNRDRISGVLERRELEKSSLPLPSTQEIFKQALSLVTSNNPDKSDLFNLKQAFKKMLGYTEDEPANFDFARPGSLLDKLNQGENVLLKPALSIEPNKKKACEIDAESIQKAQTNIQVNYNKEITPQEIQDIQLLNATGYVTPPQDLTLEQYKKSLENKAHHFVVRGETVQYLDDEGKLLEKPYSRIFYQACFPTLPSGNITQKEKADYKSEVQKTLRLMFELADKNKDSVSISLAHIQNADEKALFADALVQFLANECENNYKNISTIFLPETSEIKSACTKNGLSSDLEISKRVILNPGDTSSPQLIAQSEDLEQDVAEMLPSTFSGNLSLEAEKIRYQCPTSVLVLDPRFNPALLDKQTYGNSDKKVYSNYTDVMRLQFLELTLKQHFSAKTGSYRNDPKRRIPPPRVALCDIAMQFIALKCKQVEENKISAHDAIVATNALLSDLGKAAQAEYKSHTFGGFGESKFKQIADNIISQFSGDKLLNAYNVTQPDKIKPAETNNLSKIGDLASDSQLEALNQGTALLLSAGAASLHSHEINPDTVKKYQKNIQFAIDPNSDLITSEDVADIQMIIATGNIKGRNNRTPEEQKQQLIKKLPYMVVRGEADQYYDYYDKEKLLKEPLPRVFYYAHFPNLQKGTLEWKEFTKKNNQGEYKIKDKAVYKSKIRATLALMFELAAANKDPFNITFPPDSFFEGLTPGAPREEAKRFFAEAVMEFISKNKNNPDYKFIPAIFLPDTALMRQSAEKIDLRKSLMHEKIMYNNKNTTDIQLELNKKGLSVAQIVVGDALGPIGAGVASDNDFHKCPAAKLVFDPQYNPHVFKIMDDFKPKQGTSKKAFEERSRKVDNPGGGDCGFYSWIGLMPHLQAEMKLPSGQRPLFDKLKVGIVGNLTLREGSIDEATLESWIKNFTYNGDNEDLFEAFKIGIRTILVEQQIQRLKDNIENEQKVGAYYNFALMSDVVSDRDLAKRTLYLSVEKNPKTGKEFLSYKCKDIYGKLFEGKISSQNTDSQLFFEVIKAVSEKNLALLSEEKKDDLLSIPANASKSRIQPDKLNDNETFISCQLVFDYFHGGKISKLSEVTEHDIYRDKKLRDRIKKIADQIKNLEEEKTKIIQEKALDKIEAMDSLIENLKDEKAKITTSEQSAEEIKEIDIQIENFEKKKKDISGTKFKFEDKIIKRYLMKYLLFTAADEPINITGNEYHENNGDIYPEQDSYKENSAIAEFMKIKLKPGEWATNSDQSLLAEYFDVHLVMHGHGTNDASISNDGKKIIHVNHPNPWHWNTLFDPFYKVPNGTEIPKRIRQFRKYAVAPQLTKKEMVKVFEKGSKHHQKFVDDILKKLKNKNNPEEISDIIDYIKQNMPAAYNEEGNLASMVDYILMRHEGHKYKIKLTDEETYHCLILLNMELDRYFSEEFKGYRDNDQIKLCNMAMQFMARKLEQVEAGHINPATAMEDAKHFLAELADAAQTRYESQSAENFGDLRFKEIIDNLIKQFSSNHPLQEHETSGNKVESRLNSRQVYTMLTQKFEKELGFELVAIVTDNADKDSTQEYGRIYKNQKDNKIHVVYFPAQDRDKRNPSFPEPTLEEVNNAVNNKLQELKKASASPEEALTFDLAEVERYYTLSRRFDTGPLKDREHFVSLNQMGDEKELTAINSQPWFRFSDPDTSYLKRVLGDNTVKEKVFNTNTQLNLWDCGYQVIESHMCSARGGTVEDYKKIKINDKTIMNNLSHLLNNALASKVKRENKKETQAVYNAKNKLANLWQSIYINTPIFKSYLIQKDSNIKNIDELFKQNADKDFDLGHLQALYKELDAWLVEHTYTGAKIKGLTYHSRTAYGTIEAFKSRVAAELFLLSAKQTVQDGDKQKIEQEDDFIDINYDNPDKKEKHTADEITEKSVSLDAEDTGNQNKNSNTEDYSHREILRNKMDRIKQFLYQNPNLLKHNSALNSVYNLIKTVDFVGGHKISDQTVLKLFKDCQSLCTRPSRFKEFVEFFSQSDSTPERKAAKEAYEKLHYAFKNTSLVDKTGKYPEKDFELLHNAVSPLEAQEIYTHSIRVG